MSNRERMAATLAGERPDYIPFWNIGFNTEADARRLVPPELVPPDLYYIPADGAYGFAARETADLDTTIRYNRFTDQVATGVGRGANFCFGHAGPGEFNSRVVEQSPGTFVVEYETGARDRHNVTPQYKHQLVRPVQTLDDLDRLELPDPDHPARWKGFAEDVAYLKSAGEYTVGWVNGFFSGGHYFFCDYQDWLANLLLEPELVERLLARLGDWNLRAARNMLAAGVDCIGFCDDLGATANLLISPAVYRRYFLPWHAALAEEVHAGGGVLHMHCHGNINAILDDIVGTGLDMLNPVDRTDGMDLGTVRERHPRLTIVGGGIDKFLYERPLDEIEAGLRESVEIAGRRGRFVFMDGGGVPEAIDRERYLAVQRVSRRVRGQPNP